MDTPTSGQENEGEKDGDKCGPYEVVEKEQHLSGPHGKLDDEDGSLRLVVLNPDRTVVFAYDRAHDGKSNTSAMLLR